MQTTDRKMTGQKGTPQTQGRGNEMRRTGRPTHEEVAKRAYELFLARGGAHGRHEEDWLQAERELARQ